MAEYMISVQKTTKDIIKLDIDDSEARDISIKITAGGYSPWLND